VTDQPLNGVRLTFAWEYYEPYEVARLRDAYGRDEILTLSVGDTADTYRVMSWSHSSPERTASFVLVRKRHP
jgi:hypothetical protein